MTTTLSDQWTTLASMPTLSIDQTLQALADNDAALDTNFQNVQKWSIATLFLTLGQEARHWRAQLRVLHPNVDDDRRSRAAARLAARMVIAQFKGTGIDASDDFEATLVERATFQLGLDEQVDPTADLF